MKFLPNKLKFCRKEIGISQERFLAELARLGTFLSRTTINSWESGTTKPNAEQLARIATFFNKEIGFFFADKAKHGKIGGIKC